MESSSTSRMFEAASQLLITGGAFIGTQNNAGRPDEKEDANIKALYNNVSWNAILNSGGRADTVRCYPGTREAVMAKIERWVLSADALGQRIFWLSGPAGAGKSAIAQSIAERCLAARIPMANFFFFRADYTRNNSTPLTATILSQIFEICPVIKWRIRDTIADNFFIFDTSVEQQLRTLIFEPTIGSSQVWTDRQKILLLLDGLDECSSEAAQLSILRTLHDIVTHKDSPFILFVSSRADHHLTRAFNAIHNEVARLYLDGEDASSSDDIRRLVVGEFDEIKRTHHLAWTLDVDWPSPRDIDLIVIKSSGHFIYAATVMRFLHTSPESPMLSLEKVEGIRPVEDDSPFAQLDAIYSHILAKAKNWPKARDILAAHVLPDIDDWSRLPYGNANDATQTIGKGYYKLAALGYKLHEISSYIADLTALVKVDSGEVKFYHTSLRDFLLDKRRSGDFFVDLDQFRLKLVPALFYCVSGVMDDISWTHVFEHFVRLNATSEAMTMALSDSPLFLSGIPFDGPTMCRFLVKIDELYVDNNPETYRLILKKWLSWFHKNHGTLRHDQLTSIRYASEMWDQLSWPNTNRGNTSLDPLEPLVPEHGSTGAADRAISEMLAEILGNSGERNAPANHSSHEGQDQDQRATGGDIAKAADIDDNGENAATHTLLSDQIESSSDSAGGSPPPQEALGVPIHDTSDSEPSTLLENELHNLLSRSIGDACVHELRTVRAEAESSANEVSQTRAALVRSRMHLEAAFNEARMVRTDTQRQVDIARAEVYMAIAERDAAREEAEGLQVQILSAREELRRLAEEKSLISSITSWWSPPESYYL